MRRPFIILLTKMGEVLPSPDYILLCFDPLYGLDLVIAVGRPREAAQLPPHGPKGRNGGAIGDGRPDHS